MRPNRWLLLTAHMNSSSPYPTVPSPTRYRLATIHTLQTTDRRRPAISAIEQQPSLVDVVTAGLTADEQVADDGDDDADDYHSRHNADACVEQRRAEHGFIIIVIVNYVIVKRLSVNYICISRVSIRSRHTRRSGCIVKQTKNLDQMKSHQIKSTLTTAKILILKTRTGTSEQSIM